MSQRGLKREDILDVLLLVVTLISFIGAFILYEWDRLIGFHNQYIWIVSFILLATFAIALF